MAFTMEDMGKKNRRISDEARAIGSNLAALRRRRGLTQAELSQKLGILQPMVSDYELGKLRLHGQLILKLARIFGVTTDELLGAAPAEDSGLNVQRRFLRKLRDVEDLSHRDQKALLRTIEAFIRGQLRKSA